MAGPYVLILIPNGMNNSQIKLKFAALWLNTPTLSGGANVLVSPDSSPLVVPSNRASRFVRSVVPASQTVFTSPPRQFPTACHTHPTHSSHNSHSSHPTHPQADPHQSQIKKSKIPEHPKGYRKVQIPWNTQTVRLSFALKIAYRGVVPQTGGFIRMLVLLTAVILGTLQSFPQARPNLARDKPVFTSGPTWNGLPAVAINDENPATFSHPLDAQGTLDFYFEIDLGTSYQIEEIILRNRQDGCCPERLSNYRVEVYADNQGEAGLLNWSAIIRADGSHSGAGGTDLVTKSNSPAGRFAGRFVRIVNNGGAPYSPQMAEVEVYGGFPPEIRLFTADDDTISSGQNATLRWEIAGAMSASISEIGVVPPTNGMAVVRPISTTAYTLVATNEAGATERTIFIGVNVILLPPRISEFMADNEGALKDSDGDSSDWIEIENPNPYSLELGGFYLHDDPAQLFQWPLPNLKLSPRGYLLIFASGKDRRDPAKELHTNFRLDADGEYLALVDTIGNVVQKFPANYPAVQNFPPQVKNVSYGPGTNGVVGFFRPATPGTTNGFAFAGVVIDTKFGSDRGLYETNFDLVITSGTPDAVIRYTLDRTEPTPTRGSVYAAPIRISRTTIVRAAAFKEGWAPTDIDTQTYIFPSDIIASAVMRTNITRNPAYASHIRPGLLDLPSVSLTMTSAANDTTEVKTSIEWLRPDGQPGFQEYCGVKHYGGAFTTFPKKNFRLYFRSEYGAAKLNYPLFEGFDRGMAPVDQFNQLELRGGSHDMSQRGFYMGNIFADDTLLDMGHLNPHGRFVHLYLNGSYGGLYQLRERWDAAMHESYLGGARTNYESINGNWNVGGWAEPGTSYDGDGSTWTKVKSLRRNYSAVKPLLDVPQYVDFMLMWMFGGAEDEYRCVGPTVPGSGFKFYLNDADGWFCIPQYCAADNRTSRGAPGRSPGDGPGSLFSMLHIEGNPEYRTLLADHIYKALVNGGPLTPPASLDRLNVRCEEVARAFIAESARWGYLTPTEWTNRLNSARSWLLSRTTELLSQFRAAGFYPNIDAPVLNQQGGPVPVGFQPAFTPTPRGTIYYTLDGSDPRLPGGGISPSAQPITSGGFGETLVAAGARWRWFTDGPGLDSSAIVVGHPAWTSSSWKHPAFDDSRWLEGPAELGYGENDEATVLPFGPNPNNKWTTAYFRRRFVLATTNGLSTLTLRLKRDDGAIVYLNGREVARSSIRIGAIAPSTFADSASDDGQTFQEFPLAPTLLATGENLVAVEVHQATTNSSDLSFDLELNAVRSNPNSGTNAPPALIRNALIKSRVKDGAQWSALNEAFFQAGPDPVSPGDIVVSQLSYDPAKTGAEFIELLNLSPRAINLRGVQFTEGIIFRFPENRDTSLAPGQRLVLVEDLFRFQQRYGLDVPIAGIYSSSLAPEGERITLASASTNVLATFAYGTSAPWPSLDQSSFTLVLAHPQLGLQNPAAWRLSTSTNPIPGASDSTRFTGDPAADADADGLPALLEYALGTSDTDPASGSSALSAGFDSSGFFTIIFPRNRAADDVLLVADQSSDLASWSPAALISTRPLAPGISEETWGAHAAARNPLFLRLRVIRP